jgi:bifunctional non-homologous end joining protein LigD
MPNLRTPKRPGRNTRSAAPAAGQSPFEAAVAASGARLSPLRAADVELMLAETADEPWGGPDWIFELKVDGYRAVAGVESADKVSLIYRRGSDAIDTFPDLRPALSALAGGVVLDGEVAVLDERGRPSFQRLQKRALRGRPTDVEAGARDLPAVYFAFDLLAAGGRDLRALPLLERKRLLGLLLEPPGEAARPWAARVRFLGHVEGEQGPELFSRAAAVGLEGVVGKRRESPYRAGRRSDWRKLRVDKVDDFAVVGFTRGEGARATLGALHVAAPDAGGALVYAGSVGSGLRESEVESLERTLSAEQIRERACSGPKPPGKNHVWVTPRLVIEVRYKERTDEGLLRQPVFLRVRDDKTIDSLERAHREPGASAQAEPLSKSLSKPLSMPLSTPLSKTEPARPRHPPQKFSNLTKPLWPDDGITKGDLIAYYRAISPWLLPWLSDRPITLTRYPDGIAGKSFFQKNAPDHTPDWIRTAIAPAERWGDGEGQGEPIHAIVVDDLDTLLYVANLAAIPLHAPAARVGDPDHPDWGVVDLDPKGAPFADVVACALELRAQAEAIGLPCFPKTSGQAGLHVLIPLGAQLGQAETRQLCELLSRLVEQRLPKISTLSRPLDQRLGRVYLDTLQNGRGKTIAAAYSVRPVPGATASTPLRWDEVGDALDPKSFTLRTLPARAASLGEDPCAPALTLQPDLPRALALLGERLRVPVKK